MTFWKDGFQFDDGGLRRYDDPTQTQILDEINAGWAVVSFEVWRPQLTILSRRAPPLILNVRPGQRVELRVTKRTEEDYIPPKKE